MREYLKALGAAVVLSVLLSVMGLLCLVLSPFLASLMAEETRDE